MPQSLNFLVGFAQSLIPSAGPFYPYDVTIKSFLRPYIYIYAPSISSDDLVIISLMIILYFRREEFMKSLSHGNQQETSEWTLSSGDTPEMSLELTPLSDNIHFGDLYAEANEELLQELPSAQPACTSPQTGPSSAFRAKTASKRKIIEKRKYKTRPSSSRRKSTIQPASSNHQSTASFFSKTSCIPMT